MKQPNLFQTLGFDEKTERVYKTLLALADSPAFRIAKESGIKRTSVYHILEHLAAMGLVSTTMRRGVTRYIAENPQKIKAFFEQKMILAERILPELEREISKGRAKVAIRLLEGKDALKSISEEALMTKERIIYSIGSSKKLVEFLGGTYGYGQRRRTKGIRARSLRSADDDPITNSHLHQARILPKDFSFPGYIMMYDTTVIIIFFEGNGYGCIITSPTFVKMMRSFFELLWTVSR